MKNVPDNELKEIYEWMNRNWGVYSWIISIITMIGVAIIWLFIRNYHIATALCTVWGIFQGMTVGIMWHSAGKPTSKKRGNDKEKDY